MLKASARYHTTKNVSHLDITAYISGNYRRGRQAKRSSLKLEMPNNP